VRGRVCARARGRARFRVCVRVRVRVRVRVVVVVVVWSDRSWSAFEVAPSRSNVWQSLWGVPSLSTPRPPGPRSATLPGQIMDVEQTGSLSTADMVRYWPGQQMPTLACNLLGGGAVLVPLPWTG